MFAGLEVFQSAIRGVIQTMNNVSLECATNLSYAAGYVLRWGTSDIKDENVFRLWRSIFEDLGQLLQDVIARQGKTDLSDESVELLGFQIDWMDDLDIGEERYEWDSNDDAAYTYWSQTFEPGHSMFDDRFISAMAKLCPKRRNEDWRIRRLEDMQKQEEVQAKNGKKDGEGTATTDENDEEDTDGAWQSTADERSLTSSEPKQSTIYSEWHSDEGGADGESVVGSEVENGEKAVGGAATADDDDEDDINGMRIPIADKRGLASSEPGQSAAHSHSDESLPDGDSTLTSEAKNGKKVVGGTTDVAGDGDDNALEGASRFIQDERTLTSDKPERSANVPSHSNEGDGRDGDVVVANEVKNGETEAAGGTATVHEDDEDDSKGVKQPISDKDGLTSSEPGPSTFPSHPDEGEPNGDSALASEIKNELKKSTGGTTTVVADDEDDGKGSNEHIADESTLTSSEQEQPVHASLAHPADGGGPDRPSGVKREESDKENIPSSSSSSSSPEGEPSAQQGG